MDLYRMKALNVFDIFFILTLGSALDIWPFYIGSAGLLLTASFIIDKREFRLCKASLIVVLIFLIGIISTFFYLASNVLELTDEAIQQIVYRTRKFSLEFFVGIALYFYARICTVNKLYMLVGLSVLANFLVGVVEFSMAPFDRLNLMFFEPSSAALFLLFALSFVLWKPQKNLLEQILSGAFLVLCALTGSKALVLCLLLLFGARLVSNGAIKGVATVTFAMFFLGYGLVAYWPEISAASELASSTWTFLKVFFSEGFQGLQIEKGVYGTFVTRLTSIGTAVYLFVTNPLGIGFGAFGVLYVPIMDELGLSYLVSGVEVQSYLYGEAYASPKSKLLEVLLSTGWIGVWLFYRFVKVMTATIDPDQGRVFLWAALSLLLGSIFIELNNLYMYLFVISGFFASSQLPAGRMKC